ncbi:MAG: hypothetical protein PHO71_22120 [Bacteroides sp.]|nr:hypothetical protein [Bacteroides sp.]
MPEFHVKELEGFFWEYLPASRGANSLIVFYRGIPVTVVKYRGKKIPILVEKFLSNWMLEHEVYKSVEKRTAND